MHLGDQRSFVALHADRRLKLRESYSSRVNGATLVVSSAGQTIDIASWSIASEQPFGPNASNDMARRDECRIAL